MKQCPSCHEAMHESQFLFDHEPGDVPEVSASLEWFRAMGIKLGARVTMYLCGRCDQMIAEFDDQAPL